MAESLQEKLNKNFQDVKKKFNYPILSTPEIKDKLPFPAIIEDDVLSYKISIQKSYLEEANDTCLKGILSEEVDHYITHPRDVERILLELTCLEKYPNKEILCFMFDDYVVNLNLVLNKNIYDNAENLRTFGDKEQSAIRLMLAYLSDVTGLDYGIKPNDLDEKLKEKLALLKDIRFLNLNHLRYNIQRFATIMQDVELPIKYPGTGIFQFRPQDLEKALTELAGKLSIEEYRKMLGVVNDELEKRGGGIGPGYKRAVEELGDSDIAFYLARAKSSPIKIKGLPLCGDGGLYPASITDFSLDDDINDWDPINSLGKLIPGLAKKFFKEEFVTFGKREKIPDAWILIDSSDSMKNPAEYSPAVDAGCRAAHSYIENGACVGVTNFSDTNLNLMPTNDLMEICKRIRKFQAGGTTPDLKELQEYAMKLKELTDMLFISDAGLHNMVEFLEWFEPIANIHRITVIWVYNFAEEFVRNYNMLKTRYKDRASFNVVMNDMDIPKIVVGELNKIFY